MESLVYVYCVKYLAQTTHVQVSPIIQLINYQLAIVTVQLFHVAMVRAAAAAVLPAPLHHCP